jgi:hypothetical protein
LSDECLFQAFRFKFIRVELEVVVSEKVVLFDSESHVAVFSVNQVYSTFAFFTICLVVSHKKVYQGAVVEVFCLVSLPGDIRSHYRSFFVFQKTGRILAEIPQVDQVGFILDHDGQIPHAQKPISGG